MPLDLFVVFAGGTVAACLSWLYFRRYVVTRPPIGVFNLGDVALLMTAIAVIPYLYLELPLIVVACVLTLSMTSILYFTLEPVLRRRPAILVAAVMVGVDTALALTQSTTSNTFLMLNNGLMVAAVVGVANLWAQSGMGAREVTVLGAALAVYDFVATSQLTLMTDLIGRLSDIPLVPFVAWDTASGAGLGVGVGDLLLLSVFPLSMRKSFGRKAGLVGLCVGLAVLAGILLVIELGVIETAIPVMVVLGPLMVAQYVLWDRRLPQRTTWQYLRAEPLAGAGSGA
ncbi:MAG TPA: hypothetical protein VHF25_07745 [Nitriliruptorales bacterium]|nr:hypothetical protein [Nitriliruptorales bacterium]